MQTGSPTVTLPILIKWCVRQRGRWEDIRYIEETIGLEQLAPTLREMAQVRLDNPDVSLQELGTYLDPPVGKSGVNHRLRKLKEIAEGLRTEEGE
ncbi:DNA-binding protein WhiA [Eubacterium ramulus]|uniref:DNA-binding protein WhiA n=1 Tax=Eubacterium ramulus TaxID=39490 RepID=UPI00300E9991